MECMSQISMIDTVKEHIGTSIKKQVSSLE